MAFNKNSVVHNIALLYCAFTHITDGEVSDEELQAVAGHSFGWMDALGVDLTGDDKVDIDDVKKLLFEDVIPYYNTLDTKSRISSFVDTAMMLKSLDWWKDEFSVGFLNDLKQIANSDGNYHENEKKWIGATAEIFGVDSPA
jgi:hypothetical protein|tara:strand:- start:538 stop:963 length:426 start_codon:yes stop_codon:yes gene_type:complete